jgi:hypothetical protein
MIVYFAVSLRNTGIASSTITSYISHVADALVQMLIIENSNQLRCQRLRWLLQGWKRDDSLNLSKRHSVTIPLTYALLLKACDIVDELFADNKTTRLALKAALCLGYACSMRPCEYLLTGRPRPLDGVASTNHTYLWWGDESFPIFLFPRDRGPPDAISFYVDKLKNDMEGNGGPRGIVRCPKAILNLIDPIYDYILHVPPLIDKPFLASHGDQVSDKHIKKVLHPLAIRTNIDPTRLIPYSLRSGVLSQIDTFSNDVKMRQGFWTSEGGMKFYARKSLNHARMITESIHDPDIYPISWSQNMYHG